VRPGDRRLLPVVRRAPEAIGWLEDRLGPLPSDRMGFVIVPDASGMETQDMITLGRDSIRRGGDQVVAHELAHQWYGDAVTPSDWRDVWMNEGMATYLQAEWTVTHGQATWDGWETQLRAADDPLRRRYGPPGAYKVDQFAQGNVYFCAALMWRVLHDDLGDAAFARLRRAWIQEHLYSNEDRDRLAAWWSEGSGKDLTDFFTTWLLAKKTPPS